MTSMSSSEVPYKTFNIAGLPTHVFGLEQVDSVEVAVLFFLHGRLGKWEDGTTFIAQMLQQVKVKGKSLVIVTFDQRNHGHRLTSTRANSTWTDKVENLLHAQDMHSIQTGTAHDVSLLIDYLPAYLFPRAEKTISQWLCSGISLGGHSTWIVLSREPRVQAGCPIIGCPDFMALMESRAKPLGGLTKEMMPDSLRAVAGKKLDINAMQGKRILILSGGKDKLVPYEKGAAFVEELKAVARVQVEIYEGVGHRCTVPMIKELSNFLTTELAASPPSSRL